jgi:hypothetical protein
VLVMWNCHIEAQFPAVLSCERRCHLETPN